MGEVPAKGELALFQEKIGYRFRDEALLMQALTHTSYANEHKNKAGHYERLEFLGDAVLELVSSAHLLQHYPDKTEGDLTKLRATLVCEAALASCARALGLPALLKLGRGEEENGGREKDSILCDVCESLIGAMYLDAGESLGAPKAFILTYLLNNPEERSTIFDAKSTLQERVQQEGKTVRYVLLREEGLAHDKLFVTGVYLGEECLGTGTGKSKKNSEQEAAREALSNLQ